MPPLSDPHGYETLYREHHGWLQQYLLKKVNCSEQAADLAHDTFLRLMTSNRSPAALGEAPRALLTHIAKGLVVDHWRRQEVERAYLEALADTPTQYIPSPEERLLIIEALTRIEAMLSAMPARTRDIFLMAQLDGQTYSRIAARFGVSLSTVKRHMRKAYLACLSLDVRD